MPALARRGVVILRNPDRNAAQREWVHEYLHREVRPLLSPIGWTRRIPSRRSSTSH